MRYNLALAFAACLALLTGCTGKLPANLGAKNGLLSPCPATPNCVSSQARDADHSIEALPWVEGGCEASLGRMRSIVEARPRTRIVQADSGYLRAEFRSFLFRFVDDVEFSCDAGRQVLEVRSASRVGRSDLGVNRKRVETLRGLYLAGVGK